MLHWTESRVRDHIAVCVYAAVIEAVIANQLTAAGINDPHIDDQIISPRRDITITTRPTRCSQRSWLLSTSTPHLAPAPTTSS